MVCYKKRESLEIYGLTLKIFSGCFISFLYETILSQKQNCKDQLLLYKILLLTRNIIILNENNLYECMNLRIKKHCCFEKIHYSLTDFVKKKLFVYIVYICHKITATNHRWEICILGLAKQELWGLGSES